jgi:hypothetical protein
VRAPGGKPVTLRYAYAVKNGDRWRVILGTTEPLGFAASWAESRGAKHDVAVLILDIGEHYQGTGQLFLGSTFGYDQKAQQLTLTQTIVPAIDFHSVSAYD